jgi:uncharacterized protein with NRDE domain
MCTILLRWDPAADVTVLLAANRDEFRARLADEPGEIVPGVFAGRDRTAGGTWLAVSRAGVAALTNVRGGRRDPGAPSRGGIALAVLAGALPSDLGAYNGFNLLVVDRAGARVVSHAGAGAPATVHRLPPGTHVVDNEPFGVESPRVRRALALLARDAPAFAILGDHGTTSDDGLCHHGDVYGTVSATVIALDAAMGIRRYHHVTGPPCSGTPADLTAAAQAVVGC